MWMKVGKCFDWISTPNPLRLWWLQINIKNNNCFGWYDFYQIFQHWWMILLLWAQWYRVSVCAVRVTLADIGQSLLGRNKNSCLSKPLASCLTDETLTSFSFDVGVMIANITRFYNFTTHSLNFNRWLTRSWSRNKTSEKSKNNHLTTSHTDTCSCLG